MTLPDLTRELIAIRRKPGTQERFKSYPGVLAAFSAALAAHPPREVLREVITADSSYYLPAGYRQQVLEQWLAQERTPEVLRLYASQLMLFGDVDEVGEANTDTDARVEALEAEAARLEQGS